MSILRELAKVALHGVIGGIAESAGQSIGEAIGERLGKRINPEPPEEQGKRRKPPIRGDQ